MEAGAAIAALILLLIVCSGSSHKTTPEYRIEQTQDSRYYEVIDSSGETRHIGTYEACEQWIREQTT